MDSNSSYRVYENEDLLAISKPIGISSHPLRSNEKGTAVDIALEICPSLDAFRDLDLLELSLLHRLDRETSGLLLFAKNRALYPTLRELIRSGNCKKTYVARVCVDDEIALENVPLQIDSPLSRLKKSKKRMKVLDGSEHKNVLRGPELSARTRITKILKQNKEFADIEVQISKGRMHQIRAHLASRGLPILGDTLYGSTQAERLYLHASGIEFELNGKSIAIVDKQTFEK